MSPLPGEIRQIGYVVRDFDEALATWIGLGVGPWFVIRALPHRASYRGEPCAVTLSIAFANSGDMQIELIHQHDDTPSIYTNQLAWWAADFDAAMAAAQSIGWPVVWSGGEELGTRFAYLETSGVPAPIVAISQLTDATAAMAKLVRDAAQDWDGSDPVRVLWSG
jgi:hypothetical protein